METDYFVKVSDPTPLRILLLQASKDALISGKFFLDLQEIRDRKAAALEKLDAQIATLTADFASLEALMPHKELVKPSRSKSKSKSSKKGSSKKKSVRSKGLSELEKIDAALAAIEDKINQLT